MVSQSKGFIPSRRRLQKRNIEKQISKKYISPEEMQ
jgi:hypothetical protein